MTTEGYLGLNNSPMVVLGCRVKRLVQFANGALVPPIYKSSYDGSQTLSSRDM